ncbi:unnamed protein product [Trifolium pratense]|uniref:Uncharacterized protein n=1 Tax=Trifolium pratense TaxID=57577 RepID=A0ACB0KZH2_TRIPR|nr:unnamed protein product [Trifolium pratense]
MLTQELLELFNSNRVIAGDNHVIDIKKQDNSTIGKHFSCQRAWNLQSCILRFIYVPAPHSSDILCASLVKCLMEWNIDTKLSTITLDNCSTNDAMIDKIKEKLSLNTLLRDGSLLHMRCVAHILNLIVKDGLEVLKDGIERIRDSVAAKRKEKFEKIARQLRNSHTKNLCLDCPTRWNSTYKMLDTAILYEDVFSRLRQCDTQYTCVPTSLHWKFAKDVCQRLKLFNGITELISGTKYPTANMFFPEICKIKLAISNWIGSSNKSIAEMAKNMLQKFDKYWSVTHDIMGVATVLDPRYKMELLEYYYEKLYGQDSLEQVRRIQKLCYDLIADYQLKFNQDICADSAMLEASCAADDGLDDYDAFVRKKKRAKTSLVRTELDHYLDEEVLPRSPGFDILLWWKLNGIKYPTLQAIAKDILAIPISTVASESAFSTSGQILSPHRSRLHWTTLEALMCARSWLWSAENSGNMSSKLSNEYATLLDEIEPEDEGEIFLPFIYKNSGIF